MTNSKIKEILLKIEDVKILVIKNNKQNRVEKVSKFKKKALKVLEKTLNYLEEK